MAQHGADGVQTPGRSTRVSVRPRRPVRHHWVGGQARGVMGMQPLHISSQSGLEYGRVSLLVPASHAPTIPHCTLLHHTTCRHRAKPNPWHVVSPSKGPAWRPAVESMARVPIAHDALGCVAASPAYLPFVQPQPLDGSP